MNKLPAIVTDIDGVIMSGNTPILGCKEALERVLAGGGMDKNNGSKGKIPFLFLTNSGHYTEK